MWNVKEGKNAWDDLFEKMQTFSSNQIKERSSLRNKLWIEIPDVSAADYVQFSSSRLKVLSISIFGPKATFFN